MRTIGVDGHVISVCNCGYSSYFEKSGERIVALPATECALHTFVSDFFDCRWLVKTGLMESLDIPLGVMLAVKEATL